MKGLLIVLVAVARSLSAASIAADSARGARLFETLSCIECHSVNGAGGKLGPDLGQRIDRSFTPATLAATLWNHAPAMWGAMRERNLRPGDLNDQAAADLFAYFYSTRMFEKPGDAGRGKQAFSNRGCAACHGLTAVVAPGVKPVSQWDVLADPVILAEEMWNHRARMLAEAGAKGVRWPALSSQDLIDMLVYLRNLPAPPAKPAMFRLGAGNDGAAVFASKGCTHCHAAPALAARLKGLTLTEIAASMWNHAPKMAAAGAPLSKLESGEMRELLSYLWAEQFFGDAGNAGAGRRVFAAKHCAGCHEGADGPRLTGRTFSGITMVSALWHHGPQMLEQMKAKNITWPRFDGAQMSNLIAYLNSGKDKKP